MIKLSDLIALADQFVTERNWWQFHNPKNDVMSIMVEAGELAELFITGNKNRSIDKIAEEMSDILCASFCFAILTNVDIAHSLGLLAGDATFNNSESFYEQLKEFIMQNLDSFNLNNLTTPQQVVLSLTAQVSQLADIFVWFTTEQSIARAQEKHSYISAHTAHIVAHLLYLSSLADVDLPTEYVAKMQKNCSKYPLHTSSGSGYIEIKDASRGRNN